MRFDVPVFFQRIQADYDASTGNYATAVVSETQRLASVTSSGGDMLRLVYGNLKQDSLTIRLQSHYTEPFDRIRIGSKLYCVDMTRKLRRMQTFVVSEVQPDEQNN